MAKEKNKKAAEEEKETTAAAETEEEKAADEQAEPAAEEEKNNESALKEEIASLKDKLMRHVAEFDNYKKRTQKEKEELYKMAVCDTVEKLLPVKDNLERALTSLSDADEKVAEGVKMIDKQFKDVLKDIGVEEIESVGASFNPEKHNAVMHEENEDAEENTVVEEFMKGYSYKDKVIRHSVVKVAN